ncbi:MAG: hypothetical protein ABIP97_10900 [Chthoniobacterales bacterium]
MKISLKLIAAFLLIMTGTTFAQTESRVLPPAAQLPGEKEAVYISDSPDKKLSIHVRQLREGANDCFVEIVQSSDGKVIQSLHWPHAQSVHVLWNAKSNLVALNWHEGDKIGHIAIFYASAIGLQRLSVPEMFPLQDFLSQKSALRSVHPYRQIFNLCAWVDNRNLQCVTTAIFRETNPKVRKNVKPEEGFRTVSYEFVIKCYKDRAKKVSSKRIFNKWKSGY